MANKAEKIKRKITDIEMLTSLCVRRDSAKTVTATLKYALFVSSRELFTLVDEMYNTLESTIIDEYALDYDALHKTIAHCIADLDAAYHLNGDDNEEKMRNMYKDSTDGMEKKEAEMGYDFASCDRYDCRPVNHSLLYNQFDVENNAYGTLKSIEERLRMIINDHEAFESDMEIDTEGECTFVPVLQNRFDAVRAKYRNTLWPNIKCEVKGTVKFDLKNTNREKEHYEGWLEKYKHEASGLARYCKNGIRDGLVSIYKNRRDYKSADIEDLCQYFETRTLLETRVSAFGLTCPPNGAYTSLFVNIACQTFMERLAPTLDKVVDVQSVYEYSALLFVMMDLGIAQKMRSNVTEFVHYLKRNFGSDVDPSNINKQKRKLMNDSFGSMSDEDLENAYDENARKKLKEKYWAFFTVLNSILKRNVNEMGLQPYLDFDHEKTAALLERHPIEIDDYIERLKAVINKEDLDF